MGMIAYLCDGNGCSHVNKSCRTRMRERCHHTTDPAHAVNGACEDPQRHPERFLYLGNGKYMEREDYRHDPETQSGAE